MVTTGTYQKIMQLLELHHKIKPNVESSIVESSTDDKARRLTKELQSQNDALKSLKRYLSYFPFANFYVFRISDIVSKLLEFQKLVEKSHTIPQAQYDQAHIIRNPTILDTMKSKYSSISQLLENLNDYLKTKTLGVSEVVFC